MKKYLMLWVLTLSLLTPSVWALTLDEARTQGRVGETLNGYLVALKNDAETQKLVLDINHARRARPGEYVQGINGKWMRK
ncbi:YdbL family protein [Salmonella enterica]|uniref:YdbL family protein n=1 Tax=Salmonella enterica TaxID=28901 RepID=UPI000BA003EB|nr:YdbL family protein [Salmonella enterica]MEL30261.1 DUF1318 domain-containing protein [Salmonella enterica]OZU15262.1 hypothetical protein CCO49_20000 [Salmonella enterica subsp. arizonae serovar 47:z4,z23:-]